VGLGYSFVGSFVGSLFDDTTHVLLPWVPSLLSLLMLRWQLSVVHEEFVDCLSLPAKPDFASFDHCLLHLLHTRRVWFSLKTQVALVISRHVVVDNI